MEKLFRKFARTVVNHLGKDHKLRVQIVPECDGDLELYCVFCGVTLAMGSPKLVNELAELIVDGGFEVTKTNDAAQSVRVH